jgi:hypothetical protein
MVFFILYLYYIKTSVLTVISRHIFTNNLFYCLEWPTRHVIFTSIVSNLIHLSTHPPPPPSSESTPRMSRKRLSHPHNDTNTHTPCLPFIAPTDMASALALNASRQEPNNPCTSLCRGWGKQFQQTHTHRVFHA